MSVPTRTTAPPGSSRSQVPVSFSPFPGVLPVITLWPVLRGEVRIGGVAYKAYSCPTTRSAYAIVRKDFVSAQAGAVSIAAAIGRAADGQFMFRTPYALVAIKWEDKLRVQEKQARLKAGENGDNSMLDRSLSMYLAERGGPAAGFLPRILECWHDDSRIYSVLEYHPAELRAIIGSGPGRRLDESTARRYTAQILAALSVVHGAGWCHRDISPENVLVSADGLRAVLIDFGTALPMPQAAAAAASPAIASAAAASESGALPPPPSPSRGASYKPPASSGPLRLDAASSRAVSSDARQPGASTLKRSRDHWQRGSDAKSLLAPAHAPPPCNPAARPAAAVGAPESDSSHLLVVARHVVRPSDDPLTAEAPDCEKSGSSTGEVDSDEEEEAADDEMQGGAAAISQGIAGLLPKFPSRRVTGPQRSLRPIAARPLAPLQSPCEAAAAARSGNTTGAAASSAAVRAASAPARTSADADSGSAASRGVPWPLSRANSERLIARGIPKTLGGFEPIMPPPSHGLFCKPAYACPYYLWRRPYFGVAFDLWSVGATLFCMLEGADLYRSPIPGLDAGFSLLWDSEAAYELRDPSDDSEAAAGAAEGGLAPSCGVSSPSPSRFEAFLAQRSTARIAAGLLPLSPAVVDLLCRLLRVRPQFRPLSAQGALTHAWFFDWVPRPRLA